MATLYGSNASLRDVSVPSQKISGVDNGGLVRCMFDSYTGTPGNGDVINLMKLPKGARIINVILNATALGGSAALEVGWAANSGGDAASAAGFIPATSVASAAGAEMSNATAPAAGAFKQFQAETQVQVTMTAAAASSGTISVGVTYSIE